MAGTSSLVIRTGKDIMMRRIFKRVLLTTALLAAFWTPAAAQQQPAGDQAIFRLLTFQTTGDLRLGATQGDGERDIVDIHNAALALKAMNAPEARTLPFIPGEMKALIEVGDEAVNAVKTVYRAALSMRSSGKLVDPGGERRVFYPHTAVRLRTPIPNVRKVFGMANNYIEEGATISKIASFFLKSVDSIVGPGEPIVVSDFLLEGAKTSRRANTHEPELAFVIGRRAENVSEAEAMDYVFGYTIHNDVSGRTLPTGRSSTEGSMMTKGQRTFGPTGPYITLKEDVPDPYNLGIEARLNGQLADIPNGNTKYMVHRIATAISMLSRIMTLEPGDIVATGVPEPDTPLRVGDTIEITIERLGTLRNPVVGEGS
jgi:2-keto-4-pentenoate hydratase/2-oxohepta-3-ene-1,7-dioic acid hydratase in catechol pathway